MSLAFLHGRPIQVFALASVMAMSAAGAVWSSDAERGRELAERWCTTCHVIADDVPGGTIGPAFESMVPFLGRTEDQLKVWIAQPHDPMPNFGLSAREINDIVAYITSIERP